jgi:TatD DNase family protein
MTDTHCHLSFSQFDPDRDAVLNRAGIVGVRRIVNPGTDLIQSRAAVAMAQQYDTVWAGVGVHPQDIAELTDEAFAELETLAADPRVVAIGEVGLEISSRSPSVDEQERWLRQFVALAGSVKKPLIFHVREAHPAFRDFLFRHSEGVRGVLHCFSGTPEDAQFYVARGLFLGVTGIVTFPGATQLCRAVEETPLESLVLETDAPFLAPQPRRGKRNEPAYVLEVAEKIAELKGLSVVEVERVTDRNAQRLFPGWRKEAQ